MSPAVNSKVQQHQHQQQYGSSARNSASSGTHGWCRRNSVAAASAVGGRLGGEQIESNVQQRQCDESLIMYNSSADDHNMDMITASVALDWESSSMVRSCRRSSLEAFEFVEFDNRRKSRAAQQAAHSRYSSQHPSPDAAIASCIYDSHPDELLCLTRRLQLVERSQVFDETRATRQIILHEPNSQRTSLMRNSRVEAPRGTVYEEEATAAAASEFSGAHLSHLCQPRYSKFCLKSSASSSSSSSSSSPHDAHAVETALKDSRSSSFRSQSIFVNAWETSGDKDSSGAAAAADDSSSNSSSSSSSPESTTRTSAVVCSFKGRIDDDDQYRRGHDHVSAVTAEDDDDPNHFHAQQAPPALKDSPSYSRWKQQAAAEVRTPSSSAGLVATLLKPWKLLFGSTKKTKKKKSSSSSCTTKLPTSSSPVVEGELHTRAENSHVARRLPLSEAAAGSSSPIISWSAPMHQTSAAAASSSSLSSPPPPPAAAKTQQQFLREKKSSSRSVPYNFAHEAPAAAPISTAAETPDDEARALASSSSSSSSSAAAAGERDGTPWLRQLKRESSLPPPPPVMAAAALKSSSSSNAAVNAHKALEPRLTHSQSAILSTCSSPGGGGGGSSKADLDDGEEDDDNCAGTPKLLPVTERWKKYVKMLKVPLHTKPSTPLSYTQESLLLHKSNEQSYSNLPPLKLKASSESSTPKGSSAAAAITATRSSSKLSRIIASTVITPRSKSVTPTHRRAIAAAAAATAGAGAGAGGVTTLVNNQSTLCEQHNAVQGAIAHCKQSQSGQVNLHSIS